jgi:hypothetical protein
VLTTFRTDLFRKSLAERHNVGHHMNLVNAGTDGVRQGDRGDNGPGQGDEQDRSESETAEPTSPRLRARL